MTAAERKQVAAALREALARARNGQSAVYLSQFHASMLLELLDEEVGRDDA